MSSQSPPPNALDPETETETTIDPPDIPAPLETPGDLPAVRSLILAAYPDLVPDLVAGDSVTTLLASVNGARAAFAAVAERVAQVYPIQVGVSPPVVHPPAGGGAPLPIDPDRLPASEKIRRGLRVNPGQSR